MENQSRGLQSGPFEKRLKIGILGGGQLGRMLIQEALDLDINISVLDPAADAPCAGICHSFVRGSFNDFDTVIAFGQDKDVVTIEIENVNTDALAELEKKGVRVLPTPALLAMVKDKGLQKQFYARHNIPTADFILVENKAGILNSGFGFPMVQKLRTGGYDGRGVQVLRSADDMDRAFDAPSVLEKAVDIAMELSVIVARNAAGQSVTFPVVELVFDPRVNLVDLLVAPARISEETAEKAKDVALSVVEKSGFVGLLAVELFLSNSGQILVNEIAPRPHNSGHHTIEANVTSQYGQHLRAILDLPLGSPDTLKAGAMVNLLGAAGHDGAVRYEGMEKVLAEPGVFVHLYGKSHTKPFRKMGHITILANSPDEALERAMKVKEMVAVKARV